ncbi:MAG: LPS export ABC transporter permease LptF [Desulfobacteraceae bacterium]|jgi:lipopolysaccharide export system permease protein|nr:LPS export ABC transporter permease LptF [Desulfobacteraceae bacterium]
MMKLNTTVNRYIFKELIPPYTMNLVFFIFVFLMRQILEITNVIVNYQVGLSAFFLMLAYSMPYFLAYVIPMSVMMSVLLTFLRLSSDNEIVALKASGISIYHLVPPVILFSVINALLTAYMGIYGIPWGEYSYKQMAMNVVQSNFNIGLKERQFNDSFDGVMFYVNRIDTEDNSLKDIYIEDQRNKEFSTTIVSPKGRIFDSENRLSFILSLYDGVINQVNLKSRAVHSIQFDTYDLNLDLKNAVKNIRKKKTKPEEMRLDELAAFLKTEKTRTKKYYSVWVEFHKKFSIPFACIALGILAVPLGVQSSSSRKSAGLGIGLIAFLLYYLLLSAGLILSEAGNMSPVVGMWMPNFIMGGLGIVLLVKTANDSPFEIFDRINQFLKKIIRSFFRVRYSN